MDFPKEKQEPSQGEPKSDQEKFAGRLEQILEKARQKRTTREKSQKEEKKDTSILGGKPYIPMTEAFRKIKKASPYIPGAGGAMYYEKERVGMAKRRLGKYGYFLEKHEIPKAFKELEKEKANAKTGAEKLKINREIRYLKRELFGKK
jgi:hypothetical protein